MFSGMCVQYLVEPPLAETTSLTRRGIDSTSLHSFCCVSSARLNIVPEDAKRTWFVVVHLQFEVSPHVFD